MSTATNGVSICITAYKASKTIKATLDSIMAQTYFKDPNHKYEVIIGVDGCEETAAYLRTILGQYKNVKAVMMSSNMGTYVTSNSIMSNATYEAIIRFDADDTMCPEMVSELMKVFDGKSIVRYKSFLRKSTDMSGNRRHGKMFSKGSLMIPKSVFVKFGGYMPWLCAADDELLVRLSKFVNTIEVDKYLFDYIQYPTSLTNNNDTNMRSKLREEYHQHTNEVSAKITKAKDAVIEMVTNTYYDITQERLIVTMTSWKDRIDNVVPVVDNLLMYQTVKPDLLVINLSKEEFKDTGIPSALQMYVDAHDNVEIHWIDGPNTRQWKKTIPTMLRFPNDCVVCIDDDCKYQRDFLEALLKAHTNNPTCPITINYGYKIKGLLQHCGQGTLDKLCYYHGLKDLDLVALSKNASSDTFFTFLAHDSGNDIQYVKKNIKVTPFNPVSPLSKSEGTSALATQMKMYNYMVEHDIIQPLDRPKASAPASTGQNPLLRHHYDMRNKFRDRTSGRNMPLLSFKY